MASKETELVLYVQMQDPDFARTEGSEQWRQYEGKFENGVRTRVRIYEGGDKPRCIQTVKVDNGTSGGVKSSNEYNCEVPLDFAQGFISGCESIQNKVRDHFKSNSVKVLIKRGDNEEEVDAPELGIEFDRFLKEDGGFHPWAKVDIEIDGLLEWLRTTYARTTVGGYSVDLEEIVPTKLLKIIPSNTKDPEEKAILDQLWDTMFKKKLR